MYSIGRPKLLPNRKGGDSRLGYVKIQHHTNNTRLEAQCGSDVRDSFKNKDSVAGPCKKTGGSGNSIISYLDVLKHILNK